jgi:hypothetical protein
MIAALWMTFAVELVAGSAAGLVVLAAGLAGLAELVLALWFLLLFWH